MSKNDEYVPCGEEWKKCVMRMKKKDIVNMFADVCKERTVLRQTLDAIQKKQRPGRLK